MNLKNLIKDLPIKSINVNSSELMEIINYTLCVILETPVQETIEVGDWIIHKIDEKTFNISERYSSSDMSRFLHDEFCRKKLIKRIDRL